MRLKAGGGKESTALDIRPTGKLLNQIGDLDFETAYGDIQRDYDPRRESQKYLIHI